MKKNFKKWLDFYQEELLIGFYKKRGKAITLPHIINAIYRLLENTSGPVRILDVGCGSGHLLTLLSQVKEALNPDNRIHLYGLDKEQQLLDNINDNLKSEVKLICHDLRQFADYNYQVDFDLIIGLNTFHEVYSSFLAEAQKHSKHKQSTQDSYQQAKQKLHGVFKQVIASLSDHGIFIIYDGLAPNKMEQVVKFKIKDPRFCQKLNTLCQENQLKELTYQKKGKTYTMQMSDFYRFITTFKYIGDELWEIEKKETYAYFNQAEFQQMFEINNLTLDSLVLVNNDLGLWSSQIELIQPREFPFKSACLTAARKHLRF